MLFLMATTVLYAWYRMVMVLLSRPHQWRTRAKPLYYLGIALGLVGFVGDVLYNLTVGTVIFLEIPRELTLSSRMKRLHLRNIDDWRGKLAAWVCTNILNKYDPTGHHC